MGDSRNEKIKNGSVEMCTHQLADEIMNSEEYKSYRILLEKIKEQPDLYRKVCDYRKHNFELQNMDMDRNMYDEVMRFQMENANIKSDELVRDFLNAELSVCRIVQDVNRILMEKIEFDIEFLE